MTTAIRPRRGISSDPRHLTPAQVATLRALAASMPAAGNRRLAAAFREATGRPISEPAVRGLLGPRNRPTQRKAIPGPRPEPAPEVPPGSYPDLPRDQAAALAWIVANRPELGAIECVALLAAEMGAAR